MTTTQEALQRFKEMLPSLSYAWPKPLGIEPSLIPAVALRIAAGDEHWCQPLRAHVAGLPVDHDIFLPHEWWHALRTGPWLDELFLGACLLTHAEDWRYKAPEVWQWTGSVFSFVPPEWLLWFNQDQVYDAETILPGLIVHSTRQTGRFLPRDEGMTLDDRRALASLPGVSLRPPIVSQGREFWLPQNLGHLLFHPRREKFNLVILPSGLDHCTVFDILRPSAYHHLLGDD